MSISDKEFNFVSQNAHMLAGALVVFVSGSLFPREMWFILGLFVVLTAWKEFYYDEHYESVEVRGSNLQDFLHYQYGMIAALLVAWVFRPF